MSPLTSTATLRAASSLGDPVCRAHKSSVLHERSLVAVPTWSSTVPLAQALQGVHDAAFSVVLKAPASHPAHLRSLVAVLSVFTYSPAEQLLTFVHAVWPLANMPAPQDVGPASAELPAVDAPPPEPALADDAPPEPPPFDAPAVELLPPEPPFVPPTPPDAEGSPSCGRSPSVCVAEQAERRPSAYAAREANVHRIMGR